MGRRQDGLDVPGRGACLVDAGGGAARYSQALGPRIDDWDPADASAAAAAVWVCSLRRGPAPPGGY
eukprot:SAG31_NODE_5082_length_2754_cov_1.555556_3_plen_66_part_00